MQEPATEPYSSIQEMVIGFDTRILQATFKVLIIPYSSIAISHEIHFTKSDYF